MAEKTRKSIRERIAAGPLGERYPGDVRSRTRAALYVGLAVNLLYIILDLAVGLYARSVWFLALAAYYALLALARYLLVRPCPGGLAAELRRYRACGVLLLVIHQALLLIVALVVREGRGFRYPGYLIYAVAAYAFYAVISAAVRLRTARRYESPVLSAARAVRLAAALVSLLALETALIDTFGQPGEERFRAVMTAATGGGACLIIIALALYMTVKSTRKLRTLKEEQARRLEERGP